MAQDDVTTNSLPAQRVSPAVWGVEREARAVEAEGRAEEFQGRLMGWLSGGPPPWWPAVDAEKLRAAEDIAGLEAVMLNEFAAQFASLQDRIKDLEEKVIGLLQAGQQPEETDKPGSGSPRSTRSGTKKGDQ